MLDNYREDIFDGLVIVTSSGERRFVDAPEVERTAERAVTLNITAAECEQLGPPPSSGRPSEPVAPSSACSAAGAEPRLLPSSQFREKRENDG